MKQGAGGPDASRESRAVDCGSWVVWRNSGSVVMSKNTVLIVGAVFNRDKMGNPECLKARTCVSIVIQILARD